MSNITTFAFDSNAVRVVDRDGEPWFVAADICAALEIKNVSRALKNLDEDENSLFSNEGIHLGAGNPEVNIVSESGLYSLILGSRKPAAKRFKKWITAEVLPALRKTGRYEIPAQQQALAWDHIPSKQEINSRAWAEAMPAMWPHFNAQRNALAAAAYQNPAALKAIERIEKRLDSIENRLDTLDRGMSSVGFGLFIEIKPQICKMENELNRRLDAVESLIIRCPPSGGRNHE